MGEPTACSRLALCVGMPHSRTPPDTMCVSYTDWVVLSGVWSVADVLGIAAAGLWRGVSRQSGIVFAVARGGYIGDANGGALCAHRGAPANPQAADGFDCGIGASGYLWRVAQFAIVFLFKAHLSPIFGKRPVKTGRFFTSMFHFSTVACETGVLPLYWI